MSKTKKRILVVEDDDSLSCLLEDNLIFEGFDVACVSHGGAAVGRAKEFLPDLILLDVMLEGPDGFQLCPILRQGGQVPIIMLTARGQREDKVTGLNLGADDYVTKPFDLAELLARIHAVLRRTHPAIDSLVLGTVTIDLRAEVAVSRDGKLHLTHREFDVLRCLAERRGRVVHRDELLQIVWGYQLQPNTRSVDLAIARLRRKIEHDPHRPQFIHTVRGDGYCLTHDAEGRPPQKDDDDGAMTRRSWETI